jgi:hypothetical protein
LFQKFFTKPSRRLRDCRFSSVSMRIPRFARVTLPILVGLALWSGGSAASRAAEEHSFLIAANDGYGIEDCLGEGGECGRVVADAWCEAHGHGSALSFGPAEDVTGAIDAAKRSKPDRPYVVTCGD